MSDIKLPGVDTPIPSVVIIAAVAGLVALLLFRQGGDTEERDGSAENLLQSEFNRRLQEQWELFAMWLDQYFKDGIPDPVEPPLDPGIPVPPMPIFPSPPYRPPPPPDPGPLPPPDPPPIIPPPPPPDPRGISPPGMGMGATFGSSISGGTDLTGGVTSVEMQMSVNEVEFQGVRVPFVLARQYQREN